MIRRKKACPRPKLSPRFASRAGLSLLEVVLALAILAIAASLLAQITSQATDNALSAQTNGTAQMLCESKMAEVLAGAIPMQPQDWTQITDTSRPGNWHYKIETVTAERPNMLGVKVSVSDDPTTTFRNPVRFFLVRWVIDPNLGLDQPQQSAASGSSGATSGSTSATSGGTP